MKHDVNHKKKQNCIYLINLFSMHQQYNIYISLTAELQG